MTLLKWLTFLIESLTVILTVLLVWIYLILLTTVIVLQWLSLHREILIILLSQFPMAFLQTQKRDTPFHRVAYDYSCADCDGLHNHVSWEDIFKLCTSTDANEF